MTVITCLCGNKVNCGCTTWHGKKVYCWGCGRDRYVRYINPHHHVWTNKEGLIPVGGVKVLV